jgi:hypothetical protein
LGIFSDGKNKGDITISNDGRTWTVNRQAIEDSNIKRVGGSKVIQSADFRLVTDAQIAFWNSGIPRITRRITTNYLVRDDDRNIECDGTLTVTFPLLADITHYENIDVTNNSLTDNVTINTTGGELMADFTTFTLYPLESLTVAKGNTTYLVK